ncbi:MAG: Phosphoribosylaminoimidazole-succinocarboxamide synthase [Firmicutes bacterium]|nr:Phosphoribosylaminoimidazole-succinocarboxamide synthase [Bacillota bacterium]MDI6706161.1 phosphoribosylaminoimidazolesuccinocarboxamide synthase [Bacillota bacterium]
MKKLEMLYEGKAKKVFATEESGRYVIEYKDDATAFNGVKKGTIVEKGIINNAMSAYLFELLEKEGIPTHYIEKIDDRNMVVKSVEIVPLEVLVRNIAAGSLSKRLGLEEGTVLPVTVLEFCYKNDELGDPMINEYHIEAMKLATPEEVEKIKAMAFRINDILVERFKRANIKLVDFKLEFGRCCGEIILADEISPDTCRLWDADTNEKLDKDRFRRDLGKVEESYHEVLERLLGGK